MTSWSTVDRSVLHAKVLNEKKDRKLSKNATVKKLIKDACEEAQKKSLDLDDIRIILSSSLFMC